MLRILSKLGLVVDTHEGWNKGNPDGFNHGVYSFVLSLIGLDIYLCNNPTTTLKLAIIISVIATLCITLYFFLEEMRQEYNMDRGRTLKVGSWSRNRYQDILFGTVGSILGFSVLLGIWFGA
jgi:hypothetical protein